MNDSNPFDPRDEQPAENEDRPVTPEPDAPEAAPRSEAEAPAEEAVAREPVQEEATPGQESTSAEDASPVPTADAEPERVEVTPSAEADAEPAWADVEATAEAEAASDETAPAAAEPAESEMAAAESAPPEAEAAPDETAPEAEEAAEEEAETAAPEAEPEAAEPARAEAEATSEAEPAEAAAEAAPEEGPQWYVVHCYSGQENKVRHNLEQRIASMGMKGRIFDVIVPTEEEIEVKDGKRRTVERRVFPGYILVQMIMSEDSWYVVRNTPGVTGFVGMGNTPTPLRPEEVAQILKRMEAEAPKVKVTYKPGQKVRIIDGPFNDFIGTVSEIDMDRTKVRVMVSFFGRETPVELDFLQVEKV